jgi:hypothetical protein
LVPKEWFTGFFWQIRGWMRNISGKNNNRWDEILGNYWPDFCWTRGAKSLFSYVVEWIIVLRLSFADWSMFTMNLSKALKWIGWLAHNHNKFFEISLQSELKVKTEHSAWRTLEAFCGSLGIVRGELQFVTWHRQAMPRKRHPSSIHVQRALAQVDPVATQTDPAFQWLLQQMNPKAAYKSGAR